MEELLESCPGDLNEGKPADNQQWLQEESKEEVTDLLQQPLNESDSLIATNQEEIISKEEPALEVATQPLEANSEQSDIVPECEKSPVEVEDAQKTVSQVDNISLTVAKDALEQETTHNNIQADQKEQLPEAQPKSEEEGEKASQDQVDSIPVDPKVEDKEVRIKEKHKSEEDGSENDNLSQVQSKEMYFEGNLEEIADKFGSETKQYVEKPNSEKVSTEDKQDKDEEHKDDAHRSDRLQSQDDSVPGKQNILSI